MDDRLMKAMLEQDDHHWWYRGRRLIVDAELARLPLPQDPRILDAGCGSGRMLQELERYGRVAGIELDRGAAEVARARGHGEVRVGSLERLPWDAQSFDLITCLDVLEHTPDDRHTLSELRRVARPGGWLVLTVPAYQALWSQHDVANHHFRRYGRRALRRVAGQSGWALRRLTSFNSLLLPGAALVRLAQRRRRPNESYRPELEMGPAWLGSLLEQPLRAEAWWISRGRTLAAGLSLMAVLQNPGSE
jgi:SAM-dependent methyltransferase